VLEQFLQRFGLDARAEPAALLQQVATAYARLPYENLTKIIKEAGAGNATEARRAPAEVIADHDRWGTGGTCFALTAALLHLVRALGWQAEPILADRHYGPNTHSALLVWIDGRPHLLDPGYLIVEPLPAFESGSRTIRTSFNQLVLTARADGKKIDLATVQQGTTTPRLTFKMEPADAGTFLKAWDTSFGHDLLHYPVLTRVLGERQLYLQKNHLLVRGHDAAQRTEIDPRQLTDIIARDFGIDPQVTARALHILRRRGDDDGSAGKS
jgi:arylamine N-acetyltransferase